MHERKALRDLVMDEAAARGIAREKVWEWACLAVARDELRVELPGRASLETAIAYAKERTQFGRAIAEFQMIQWKLAVARTELDAARLLVHRAAALVDAGKPFTIAASKAKLYASEAASRAANESLQVLGGYGYLRDYPVERHLRDARLMEIGEGTSEVQRIVISRDLVHASA